MQISQVCQGLVAAICLFMVKKSQEGLDREQDLGLHQTLEVIEASEQQSIRLIPGDFSSSLHFTKSISS